MNSKKKYWKGLEQLQNTEEFARRANKEFPEYLPVGNEEGEGSSRRDFLKLMGFGIGAVSLAACEAPVRKAIPWVRKPDTVDPGVANYYASTFVSGSDHLSVVVKTREGRPIKIEGNTLSSVSGGGTTSQAEASVLSLYDKQRFQGPQQGGSDVTWEDLDKAVAALPASSRVAVVSNTMASPSSLKAIGQFAEKFASFRHVAYDQLSAHGVLEANQSSFGVRNFPTFDYSSAETIVSFGADFLGSGANSALNNKQFAKSRKLGGGKKDMSRLYVFESNLSLTGANADYRFPIKASEEDLFVLELYNAIVGGTAPKNKNLQKVVGDLKASRASLVVSGSNDSSVQLLVNAINNALGNYGQTISVANVDYTRQGNDEAFQTLVSDINGGAVDALFFVNCNPVYDHPLGTSLGSAISKVKFSLSTSDRPDETNALVQYIAPDSHYLEAWNDFQLTSKEYSLSQPAISNIFDTRQFQDSFLKWSGASVSYYDFIRANWEEQVMPLATEVSDFSQFWDQCLHDGVYIATQETESPVYNSDAEAAAQSAVASKKAGSGLELVMYANAGIGNGIQANNPWLQEMPDPITKACWDNYLTVSPKQAEEWGIQFGDMSTQLVTLTVGSSEITVPVMAQPGQAYNTMGLALGYGRERAGRVADGVGVNAYPLLSYQGSSVSYKVTSGVNVVPTSEGYKIAQTQTSQTYMGRETVIQETILKKYQEDPQAGRNFPRIATAEGFKKPAAVSLWKGHKYANHHWGMAIDLNACTGCGTCTIACQTENNIPVVGKQEVLNRREMHWIRIDRYYSTDAEEGDLAAMEEAAENPEVTFQPMMCQQCNNAPCETVCPVAATTHSSEGLNQMTYNRCIGTRYCANNCPYKVRRFNWFKYHDNDQFDTNLAMSNDLGKMVLNPDVTVRARGVMEKCTFCVQRIQAGKLEAKKENRRPVDGEVQTACVKSCPSDALVFGDMKDPESKISKLLQIKAMDKGVEAQEPRAYHVLEELRVMPNIWYMTKVRNKDEEKKAETAESSPA